MLPQNNGSTTEEMEEELMSSNNTLSFNLYMPKTKEVS